MATLQSLKPLVGVPAPFLYATALLVGLAVDRFVPWHLAWLAHILPLGWVLVGTGLLLAMPSAALLRLKRTTLNPIGHPSQLVMAGWFAITRNPMYLGLAIAYVSLCICLSRPWPLVFLVVPVALLNLTVIPFEEQQMQAAFGGEYAAYRARVRRWI